MATIASQATGNWSSTSTWSGGVLPGVNDVAQVVAGHVVTIDQNVAVQSLSNTGNGKFVLTGSTPRTITCSISMILNTTATGTCLLEIDGSYSATGSTINTGLVSIGSHTGTTALAAINILAAATGSISFTGTSWQADNNATGLEPAVLLNASTATLDINLTTAIQGNGTAFGQALVSTGDSEMTITVPLISAGLSISGGTTLVPYVKPVTINTGSIVGIVGAGTGFSGARTTAGVITVNGNIGPGSSPSLSITGAIQLIINGNVSGGNTSSGSATGITLNGFNFDITVNGNVSGGTSNSSGAVGILGSSVGGRITVNGDVQANQLTGGSGASGISFNTINTFTGISYITVTGDVRGGPNAGGISAGGSSAGGVQVWVGGSVYAGVSASTNFLGVGIQLNNNGSNLVVEGPEISTSGTSGSPAIYCTTQFVGDVTIGKANQTTTITNTAYAAAIAVPYLVADDAHLVWRYLSNNNYQDVEVLPPLSDVDSDIAVTDVRAGVVYDNDDKVGTMIVPEPDDVLYGVPVDDVVGLAHVTLADAAAITGSQIASLST